MSERECATRSARQMGAGLGTRANMIWSRNACNRITSGTMNKVTGQGRAKLTRQRLPRCARNDRTYACFGIRKSAKKETDPGESRTFKRHSLPH